MMILGVDYGKRKIGLAVSDETELVAGPLPIMNVKNMKEAVEGVTQITQNLNIEKVVVGLPTGWEGKDSPQTEFTKMFKGYLADAISIPIDFWDESYSTQKAEKGARGRKRANSDSEAARIILQEYLDYKRNPI